MPQTKLQMSAKAQRLFARLLDAHETLIVEATRVDVLRQPDPTPAEAKYETAMNAVRLYVVDIELRAGVKR
jgi:hypothetical protein